MKKLALTVLFILTICGIAYGAEQITAEEAFRIASQVTNDPIVGIWRMHPISGGRVAHMAIVPNTTNKRKNWSYFGIMLEDGFQIKKDGIKIALKQTSFAYTYEVILSNTVSRTGAIYKDGNGFAFLDGIILDMNEVEVPYSPLFFDIDYYRYAPITYMVKVRDFQMEMANPKSNLSGLSFDGLKVLSVEPGYIADQAGLKIGDTILEINGRPADENALKNIETRLAAGRTIMIKYERDGKRDMVTLK